MAIDIGELENLAIRIQRIDEHDTEWAIEELKGSFIQLIQTLKDSEKEADSEAYRKRMKALNEIGGGEDP